MRWKYDPHSPDMYRCCLCCHVRTGTILLGVFYMLTIMIAMVGFAVVVLHPELIDNGQGLKVWGSEKTFNYSTIFKHWNQYDDMSPDNKLMCVVILGGTFVMTLLLVYGAAKGRPGYLMPFFALQVVDFCLTCLTIVGYLSYVPDIKIWIRAQVTSRLSCVCIMLLNIHVMQQDDFPWKQELLKLNEDWLMLVAVMVFVVILTVKAYFMGIVWACYKYLIGNAVPTMRRLDQYEAVVTNPEDAEMLLPPKYEDVIRMSAEAEVAPSAAAPPAYSPATTQQ